MLNLSRACQNIGDWQKASEYAHEASRLALERDDLVLRAAAQELAANILTDMTDYENAELALAEAEIAYRRLGQRRECSRVVVQRARLAICAGRMDYADTLLASLGTNLEPEVYADACRVKAEKHQKLGENQWAIERFDSAAKSFVEAERFGSAIDSWGQAAEIARASGNIALAANLLFRVLDTYHISRKGLSSDEVSP